MRRVGDRGWRLELEDLHGLIAHESAVSSDSDGGARSSITRRPGPRVNDRSNARVERATVKASPRVSIVSRGVGLRSGNEYLGQK